MAAQRYKIEANADRTWSVVDMQLDAVAEMYGEFLNRISKELAEELMFLLNAEETRRSARPR